MIAVGFALLFFFSAIASIWAIADPFSFRFGGWLSDLVAGAIAVGFILLGIGVTRWLWVHA